jgi:hypothetical protein
MNSEFSNDWQLRLLVTNKETGRAYLAVPFVTWGEDVKPPCNKTYLSEDDIGYFNKEYVQYQYYTHKKSDTSLSGRREEAWELISSTDVGNAPDWMFAKGITMDSYKLLGGRLLSGEIK